MIKWFPENAPVPHGLGLGVEFRGPLWDWRWNSGGLPDNRQWREVALFLGLFCHRAGVLPSLTLTAEAEGCLSVACLWFWHWTQGGRVTQWQSASPRKGPRATDCFPECTDYRRLDGCPLNPKNTSQAAVRETHAAVTCFNRFIVSWKLIWVFFESFFFSRKTLVTFMWQILPL